MKKIIFSLILSVMLVCTMIPQFSFATEEDAAAETKSVITGFVPLETSDYYYEGNPEEGELTVNLPETLKVKLDGSEEETEISVSWEAVEDFDSTEFYFYSMKPVWGDSYTLSGDLSPALDVPWITVYKEEPDNSEIEPMMTEEEIEPIYTEEEGPIDPEETSLADLAGDTAKAAFKLFTDESYADTASNTAAIYAYLTGTMGLNTAAACGVMANINAESAMSPINLQNTYNSSFGLSDEEYTRRVDNGKGAYKTSGGTSKNFKTDAGGYGLCQWTASSRKTNLLNSALNSNVSVGDMNMQLNLLNSELQNSYKTVYTTLKNVPNNAAGAFTAAQIFCLSYEIPANTVNTAASRGNACLNNYWKTYSGTSNNVGGSCLSLCGYTYPTAIKNGKGIDVSGYAVSNYNVTSISGTITNSSGKSVYSKTLSAGSTAAKLSSLDDYMKFSKLSNGTYTYTVSAKDSSGKTVSASHAFKVSSSGSSVKTYGFASSNVSDTTNTTPTVSPAPATGGYTGTYPTLPGRGYMKKGDKGTRVKNLQKYLNWYGNYGLKVDGKYGTKTVKAVKKFQKANKIKQDGKVGKGTLNKMKSIKK